MDNNIPTDSILASVKNTMPNSTVPQDYTVFDQELITLINAELARLQQLGVGPLDEVFTITGYNEVWGDIVDDRELCALMPIWVSIRVKSVWDSSNSSVVSQVLSERVKELEFSIMDAARRYRRREEGK